MSPTTAPFRTVSAGPFTLDIYLAAEQSFGVTSTLVLGEQEAVLIDAQFTLPDAQQLVARLQASGRHLRAVYVSHGDPDYYFGLQAIRAAFPAATVYASAPTVAHIARTSQGKLDLWGPKLGAAGTTNVVLPQVLKQDHLLLEGQRLEIKGLDGDDAEHSFGWLPAAQAIIGGVSLYSGFHLWLADSGTPERRTAWQAKLDLMDSLRPALVVPAHAQDLNNLDASIIAYNQQYLTRYEAALAQAPDSAALISAMRAEYPAAGLAMALELGAKVSKGEMKW